MRSKTSKTFKTKLIMKSNLICSIATFAVSLIGYGVANAQAVLVPSDNIPTSTSSTSTASPYPYLYNMTYGEPRNYVRTIIPDQAVQQVNASIKHRQTTEFFDGLGRPLQTVVKRGHADGNDIVQPFVYDAAGRASIEYLPYARPVHQSIGEFDHLPKARLEGFYPLNQGQPPYSKIEFDNSPFNKVEKKLSPGKSWVGSGRGVETDLTISQDAKYTFSGIVPTHYITKGAYPRFRFDNVNNIVSYQDNYPEGTLSVTKVRDEDGNVKEEIKDKHGRVLMTRSLFKAQRPPLVPYLAPVDMFPINYAYTFFVYDDMDRLRVVIPPGTISPSVNYNSTSSNNIVTNTYTYIWSAPGEELLNSLCYVNRYNAKGDIIERKVPGKGIEYFVYDKRDRLVLFQDGNLRTTGKWQYNFYDGFNRLLTSGVISLSQTRAYLQLQVNTEVGNLPSGSWRAIVQNYNPITPLELYPPVVTGAEVLISNYYDNYSLLPNWFDGTKIPLPLPGDVTVVPSAYSNATKGLLTATKFKVLDPDNSSNSEWITTLNYYDAQGKIVQTVSNNLRGGKDFNSNLYYFQGMPHKQVTHHHNPLSQPVPGGATTALNHIKLEKTFRRNLGHGGNDQIWQLQQAINDGTPYNLAYYDYDHMGRVTVKQFPMANILHEYNIRGWLKTIHARNPVHTDSTYFRENIYYDEGFASKLYNGSIAGITWNNYGVIPLDDTKRKAYGYSYDKLGRLTHAEFRNNHTSPSSWQKDNLDYSVSNLSFDERGNIINMVQMGNDISGPVEMDRLNYQYLSNSNRLIKVTDLGVSTTTAQLPDFKDNANLTEEYTYDDNGNLLFDANKGITLITYNYLNKPTVITVPGKGTIKYVYDALGNRLQKKVFDEQSQISTTWDYIGNFIYKDNILQYITNEEGRCRPESVTNGNQPTATKFVYDYFIKDHLGNVRTTLTAEPSGLEYYAFHEIATANSEQLLFENVAAVRDDKPGSTNPDDLKAARLNAAESGRRIGTAIMLRVMPGDQFTFATDAYYEADEKPNDYQHTTTEEIVSSLLTTLANGTVGGKPVSESPSGQIINEVFNKPETINAIQDIISNSVISSTTPRAGLNYLFFDEKMNLLSGSGRLVVGIDPTAFENLSSTKVAATEPGFVIVYVDNQTIGKDVWFDNVQVLHYRTNVIEENHYYPYGLMTTSNSAITNEEQPLKYQGKELEKSLGIEMYDFAARMYDPQLGRTWHPDPMAVKRAWVSPYSWVQNNPVNRIDPSGAIDNPVFYPDGNYRGETKDNGIWGMPIIYGGTLDFENMTTEQLLKNKDATPFDQYSSKMKGTEQANLMTGIARLAVGMMVNGEMFSMKRLDEKIFYGKMVIEQHEKAKSKIPNFVTSYGGPGTPMIAYTGEHMKHYESTVENMISVMIIHEWFSHGIKLHRDINLQHHKAYENVINHPLWERTTNQYKAFNLENYLNYYHSETGGSINGEMLNLYNKYCEYYKK